MDNQPVVSDSVIVESLLDIVDSCLKILQLNNTVINSVAIKLEDIDIPKENNQRIQTLLVNIYPHLTDSINSLHSLCAAIDPIIKQSTKAHLK